VIRIKLDEGLIPSKLNINPKEGIMNKLFPVRLILLALLLATLSMTACKIRVLDVHEDDDSPPDTVIVVVLPPDTVTLPPDTVTLPPDTVTLPPDTVLVPNCLMTANFGTMSGDTLVVTIGQSGQITASQCSIGITPVWSTTKPNIISILSADGTYTDMSGFTYHVGLHANLQAYSAGTAMIRLQATITDTTTMVALPVRVY
jgi:hypothetical protein